LFAVVHLLLGDLDAHHRHWHEVLLAISHILLLATVGVMATTLSRLVSNLPDHADPASARNHKPGSGAR